LKFHPRLNFFEGISSQNEEKTLRIFFSKESDGIDGVGFSTSGKFNITGGKIGIAGDSQIQHSEPVFGLDDFFCQLMGRDRGSNKDDLIKTEGYPNFFSTPEMTQMDGIESPSEEPNSFICYPRFLLYLCPPPIARCPLSSFWNNGMME
jgi:hypothetical protein